jgi:WD40 repeat protein
VKAALSFFSLNGHTGSVLSVTFSHDNLIIASGSDDRSIKIWNAHLGQLLNTLRGHTDSVRSVAFSPDNLRIASGSNDYSVKIWDSFFYITFLQSKNGY